MDLNNYVEMQHSSLQHNAKNFESKVNTLWKAN